MKLEINREDKQANLQAIKKKGKRLLIAGLSSLILFSGAHKTAYAQVSDPTEVATMMEEESSVVDIPEGYLYDVLNACNKDDGSIITIGDLQQIGSDGKDTYFYINDNSSLEWLNYCTNIKKLILVISTDDVSALEQIKKLDNLEKLTIYPVFLYNITLTQKNFQWLKNSPKLKELELLGCHVEPGLLESFTNLQKLVLEDESSQEVDYKKLSFLQELKLMGDLPYEIAIGFSKSDYDTLVNKGVKISFKDEEIKNKVLEINERLEKIVKSLNVSENSTDQEKLNAILIYVLDNLSYDEEVSNAISQNIAHEDLTASFYEGGDLYGALEKDSAICGNYTALVEALAERVELNTNRLKSDNHAWNLVKIEGDYYYVDATWLDSTGIEVEKQENIYDENGNIRQTIISWDQVSAQEAIKTGKTAELEWYMEDPINYKKETKEMKESHEANNIPGYITLRPIEKQEQNNTETNTETEPIQEPMTEDIVNNVLEDKEENQTEQKQEEVENKKFEIKIGNKKWVIGGAAVVGIMTALGSAVAIYKKREKKRKERIRRQYSSYNYNNDYTYSDNNYYRHFK